MLERIEKLLDEMYDGISSSSMAELESRVGELKEVAKGINALVQRLDELVKAKKAADKADKKRREKRVASQVSTATNSTVQSATRPAAAPMPRTSAQASAYSGYPQK